MASGVEVAHALPGRVRLKVARLRGNPTLARQAEARLHQIPGIRRVEARPASGSLVLYFDGAELLSEGALAALTAGFRELLPEVDPEALPLNREVLAGQGGAGNPVGSGGLMGAAAALNAGVARLTGGVDLRLLLPLGLLVLGVRSLLKADKIPLPSWYDYFWFAFSSFVMLNRPSPEPAAPPEAKQG